MWTPTHVQITVHRAKNLKPKGKGGTNDVFVTIQLGKEKFQTTVQEKSTNPEWNEECDLELRSNKHPVLLNVYHRNFIGLDEFLGLVAIPLEDYDVYERPRSRWYPLVGKPGKKQKYRGEIEAKVTFIVLSKGGFEKKVKRTGSVKNLAEAVSGSLQRKLKLPSRDNSFKSDGSDGSTANSAASQDNEPNNEGDINNQDENQSLEETQISKPGSPTKKPEQPILPYVYMSSDSSTPGKLSDSSWKSRSMDALHVSHKQSLVHRTRGTSETGSLDSDSSSPSNGSNKAEESDPSRSPQLSDKQKKLLEERTRLIQNIQKPSPKAQRPKALQRTLSGDAPKSKEWTKSHQRAHSDIAGPVTYSSALDIRKVTTGRLSDSRDIARSLSSLREEKEPSSPSDTWKAFPGGTHAENQSKYSTLQNRPTTREEGEPMTNGEAPTMMHKDARRSQSLFDKDIIDSEDESPILPVFHPRRHSLHMGSTTKTALTPGMKDGFANMRPNKDAELSPEILCKFEDKTKEDLIRMVLDQKALLERKDNQLKDMENYIDNLLVRVMETTPKLLQKPEEHQMSPLVVRTQNAQNAKPVAPPRVGRAQVHIDLTSNKTNNNKKKNKSGPSIRFRVTPR